MKRLLRVCQFCVFLITGLLAVFGSSVNAEVDAENKLHTVELGLPSPLKKEHVLFRIHGSNTVGATLSPALVEGFLMGLGATDVRSVKSSKKNEQAIVGKYQVGNQSTLLKVKMEAHGSSTGFKALMSSSADIAASSRLVKAKERTLMSNIDGGRGDLREVVIGIDGLAIIVHPHNPVGELSLSQLRKIFTGKITHWSDVGGVANKIKVYARDSKSGTFDTFNSLVLRKSKLASGTKRFESNDRIAELVSTDINGIGFVALAATNDAKIMGISDGKSASIEPSELSVATEDYPLSRRLYFYRSPKPKHTAVVDAFLEYVESNEGQDHVKHAGFISQKLYGLPVGTGMNEAWWRLNLNVRFRKGSSNLDNKAEVDVRRLVEFLERTDHGFDTVRFIGYSNPLGVNKNSSALSRIRAQNVRWALRSEGVRNSMKAIAGEGDAIADPGSVRSEKNRRVEVWVQ
ncbi:hypothetical protein A9Q99_05095 [Gammaproteobacteria bacterium 45_16_T64]|nr:hypothetical protein A9Q99_05095 [Gammaproteobacteria bacterium 45_16_T64]